MSQLNPQLVSFVRRGTLCFVAMALCGTLLPGLASAQNTNTSYPSGPVTLLVPFTTGTGADLLALLLGPRLADKWKVSVVTDNKPGASA